VLLWRLKEPDKEVGPGKYGKVMDRDMNDLQLKPSDATHCSKWRKMNQK